MPSLLQKSLFSTIRVDIDEEHELVKYSEARLFSYDSREFSLHKLEFEERVKQSTQVNMLLLMLLCFLGCFATVFYFADTVLTQYQLTWQTIETFWPLPLLSVVLATLGCAAGICYYLERGEYAYYYERGSQQELLKLFCGWRHIDSYTEFKHYLRAVLYKIAQRNFLLELISKSDTDFLVHVLQHEMISEIQRRGIHVKDITSYINERYKEKRLAKVVSLRAEEE